MSKILYQSSLLLNPLSFCDIYILLHACSATVRLVHSWATTFWSPSFPSSENICVFCIVLLRWGWVFLERTRILSGIQFTTHFIEIFVMETKRFVGSFVHVILTRQTCGQRSSKTAGKQTPSAMKLFFRANLLYVPHIKM